MEKEQQFKLILEKQRLKEIIPFLQTLLPGERRKLAPHIIKLNKEYSAFVQSGSTWKQKQTEKQGWILAYASIVCFNKAEFVRYNAFWAMEKQHLFQILPWYVPSWLSDFINSVSDRGWRPPSLNYEYILELEDAGYIRPKPELITTLLVNYVFVHKQPKSLFTPGNLLKHHATLTSHIWYLFEYESNVNFENHYTEYEGFEKGKGPGWIDVFKLLISQGNLDRFAVLREALLAANKNFNKILSGWFTDLFLALNPVSIELVQLQAELFSLLNSQNSKVVGTSLGMLKQIANDEKFEIRYFLDYLPLLTTSTTKTIVNASIAMSELLWKKDKSLANEIAPLLCSVFINRDETLQLRTAKLLLKFSKSATIDISEIIAGFNQTLLATPKSVLQPFLSRQTKAETENEQPLPVVNSGNGSKEILEAIHEDYAEPEHAATPLETPASFEDFVFLFSQALDNNESWHLDHIAAGLIKFHGKLDAAKIKQLLPAFQRAWGHVEITWTSSTGYLDYILANFMIDAGMIIIKDYPSEAGPLIALYDTSLEKHNVWHQQWREYGNNLSFFTTLRFDSQEEFFTPYKMLLDLVLTHLKRKITLPLLSTPTHAPGWLDPGVLIQRLLRYQQEGIEPGNIDFQLAISRCHLGMISGATIDMLKSLSKPYQRLLSFLLIKDLKAEATVEQDSLWVIAVITKNAENIGEFVNGGPYGSVYEPMLSGQYPWKVFVEDYREVKHNYINGRYQKSYLPAKRSVLRLQTAVPKEAVNISPIKKFFNKFFRSLTPEIVSSHTVKLLYQYMVVKSHYLNFLQNDARRLMMMIPNNPEPFIAIVIHKWMGTAPFPGEADKRLAIAVLQSLVDLPIEHKETSHIFIAGCMAGNDKTVASYATELWIKTALSDKLNSSKLGYILGCMYNIDFAPMKRFTDLLINQMFNVSPGHNQKLEQLLVALLLQLSEQPPKGLKRLLEIFFEVISANSKSVSDNNLSMLFDSWQKTVGLQKVIANIRTTQTSGQLN